MTLSQRMSAWDTRQAERKIGQTSDLFFGKDSDLIIHEFPVLNMEPFDDDLSDTNGNRYNPDSWETENVLFMPDHHAWYQSIEHALFVERDQVTVLSRVIADGEQVISDSPTVLVSAGFWGTYVWPVFRHLTGLGL